MIKRFAGAGIAAVGLSLVLASPSWASGVRAGEFCKSTAVGTTATASNGREVKCSYGGASDPYNRYRYVGSTTSSSSGATPAGNAGGSGSSGASTTATGTPTLVNTGSGGQADRQASDLPWAVGGLGVLVAGGSAGAIIRRRAS